jgi:hypothetical protein
MRRIILSLWALIAVTHLNLSADLTGRTPKGAGMAQLARDISRKSSGEIADQRLLTSKNTSTADA